MKIRIIDFEGAPEEFDKVKGSLVGSPSAGNATEPEKAPEVDNAASELTVEEARYFLKRRALSDSARCVFRTINAGGTSGALASDVARACKIKPQQLAGVLGALGRRMANSFTHKSAALYDHAITWAWEEDQYRYWLTEPMKKALEIEGIV